MRLACTAGMLLLSLTMAAQQQFALLKDHHRVLVVFAPDGQNDQFRTQLASLDGTQMAERDLILVPVLAHWDKLDNDLRAAHAPFTEETEQAATRSRFAVPANKFTVILIGKDGGEKFRSHQLVTMDKLIDIIDAMPMRRQEIQSRRSH